MDTHDSPPRNAVQHTRAAASIHTHASPRSRGCLLSSSGNYESKPANTLAHCVPGPQRDLDSVLHWGATRAGWRDEVVRWCGAGQQTAEAWRLLANGIGGSDSAA